jgi:hypothetical protein
MSEDTYKQLLQAATARYHALLYQSYSQLSLDDKIFIDNFRYYKQMSLNQMVQGLDDHLRQIQVRIIGVHPPGNQFPGS